MWIDLERMSRSLDREQGIHEPESFDLAGGRAPLAADQLLAEAGGMRMMIFELDDFGPSAMAFGLASAVGHGRSERRSISCDCRHQPGCRPNAVVMPENIGTFLRNILKRSEEPTSELQSLLRTSYAFFC